MNAKIKSWALGLITFVSIFNVRSAWADMALSSDETQACVGSAIVLTLGGADAKDLLMYQVSTDGSTWNDLATGYTRNPRFTTDFEGTCWYRVHNATSNSYSPSLKVTAKTEGCPVSCHQTSTGDYFSGTDFDPLKPETAYNPSTHQGGTGLIPNGVVHYFNEYDVKFNDGGTAGTVRTDIKDYFGVIPYLDKKANIERDAETDTIINSYLTAESPNGKLFTIKFSGNRDWCKPLNRGTYYRYKMRIYFMPNCSKFNDAQNNNAAFRARTGYGTASKDYIDMTIYEDATNTEVGSFTKEAVPNGVTDVYLRDAFSGPYKLGQLYRAEVVYYGQFPYGNNYDNFELMPEFAQFNTCDNMKVAVDYISTEVASVCMDHGAVCLNTATTINAAGFPKGAVYVWEECDKDGNTISELVGTRGEEKISITPKEVGTHYYSVRDANKAEGSAEYVRIYFTVVGKDCDPSFPDEIEGDDKLCIPMSTGAVYEVSPSDASPSVTYHWTLKKGSDVIAEAYPNNLNAKSYFTKAENSDAQYKSVNLQFDDTFDEGDYTLIVQLIKEDMAQGSPVTKTIKVVVK